MARIPSVHGRDGARRRAPTDPPPDRAAAVRAVLRALRRGVLPAAGGHDVHAARLELTVASRLAALRGAPALGPAFAPAHIGDDFNAGSREREVWSALYHRYFGPRLSVGDLARHAGVHRRTMQRRLDEGYRRLSDVPTTG